MNSQETLIYMENFTHAYKNSENKYTREINCLEIQLRYSVLPMRPEDLLAGRYLELPLGFSPQATDGVGYYVNKERLKAMTQDETLTRDERARASELWDFWSVENTNNKIYRTYSKKQLELITHFKPFDSPATAFALYRLSGAQMNPAELLEKGIEGMIEKAEKNSSKNPDFAKGIKAALRLLQRVCISYRDEADKKSQTASPLEKKQYRAICENMDTIAFKKPQTFWQSLQLSYLFMVLSGTINYGRMDVYLGEYLQRDLERGVLTEAEAKALLKNLWSLIIERNKIWDSRIILGGRDIKNRNAADIFAGLAIEVAMEVKDVVPQLTLRCYKGMNEQVYDKALESIGMGTTFPMLYNDDLNIPAAAHAFKIDMEDAEKYVPYGCGEYVIYNKSLGTPSGTINFLHGLNSVIYSGKENLLLKSKDFDSFYREYISRMEEVILCLAQQEKQEYVVCGEEAPFLFYSVLFESCIERGKPILEGGLEYLGGTLETYGNINTADSLTAIKDLVFDKKRITAAELTDALERNFQGCELLQKELLAAPKYGNDNEAADSVAVRFHEDICKIIRDCADKVGLHSYLPVLINNSMNTTFGTATGASADGRNAGVYMANANNPMGGMDKNGITAMLNSLVKLKVDNHGGSVQNMRFSKEMFTTMLGKTKGLLQAYFHGGGSQAMITVLNRGDLENALKEPEKHQNLIVRVGGFSARFVELSREIQLELLSRTIY